MDKNKYRDFSENNDSVPIFSKGWWLDIVCGRENWDVVYIEENSKITASLPYYKKKKLGLNLLLMPPLTQHLGIWIDYKSNLTYYKKLSFEKKIISELIELLPRMDRFSQNLHYQYTNWLPFYWNDFNQTTKYTYVIKGITDLDSVFTGFRSNLKRDIKKAQGAVSVRKIDDTKILYDLVDMTYSRQGLKFKYSYNIIKELYEEAYRRGQAMMLISEDQERNIHSGIMVVWDKESAYYLLSGTNPMYRKTNSVGLLIWEAIKKLSTKTKNFDFEGSMIESVEAFFRTFGAEQVPYSNIFKINNRLLKLKHAF